jgi:hypothetical protein
MTRTWNPVVVAIVAPKAASGLKAQVEAKFHMYCIGLR